MRKRISERLADLLTDAIKPDVPIEADDLWMQQGAYRHDRWGLARWGGWTRVRGVQRSICSFDTMTQCVRQGIAVTADSGERAFADYEISRKD